MKKVIIKIAKGIYNFFEAVFYVLLIQKKEENAGLYNS